MNPKRAIRESKSLTSARVREATSRVRARNQARRNPVLCEAQERSRLVLILRRITMAVPVFPFIYTAFFVFLFTAYSFSEGVALDIIDYAVFVSPIVVVAHLVYSRMLMMCRWHRIACALPLIPQAVDQFDVYVYHFDHGAWIVVAATIIVTMTLFLIAIYKVFFTEDGRIC